MPDKVIRYKFKITIAILIVLCFGLIRTFEKQLFYDPFLEYFESDFKNLSFPELNTFQFFLSLLFRFGLNTILSLLLIYTLFRDREILKFSIFLYLFFMIALFGMFFLILIYYSNGSWILFYVRRFIIQPIFVLLFIPAFYYQQQNIKK
ncbi:exosortase F system-associated protein [Flavobacterium sp.]|uniref:exosortase F system-associated membrane protein n=1 Tax=Flavobacterium sp. TaxID=239 RepID=UPI003264E3B3